ncbi:MAG: hypothetical protein A3E37_00970 [Candidatus Andersenbacteria bacterium RIFCSPHIGHO2_12_FULL_46_9]|nr:MAG: hypothetical protein UW94_C0015G0004 [Parcubacteria group bacterium GW2011_GWA2_45_14]OGY33356.1 MAG: hypothetical protein A3B76_02425 [Candidatus Andersenbacteria bacterium RIFCSPHIGHO2_02_FULL_46_16]OGY35603.1 MAG: hypothetical protein A3E37_00970 [Candidatus Andersenbacteria bacterium RIFCSPHIGHO2_12_FULL_46_9]OGY36455.1 MAG: hypothetical protein A3I08_01425 [Candidatus Andersenbacteria bacterium RIFCSPLOWO2_02_FULL_46_11]OGY38516.1 MAG: hypothetical protein A3G57_00470 [Candidatus A
MTLEEIIEQRRQQQAIKPVSNVAPRTPFADRRGLIQTIFSAPLRLGEDLFKLTSTAKALKLTELRGKNLAEQIKNSDMDQRRKQMLANILDDAPTFADVSPPKSAKQIIGDVIGTGLFLVPGTFGIKGVTKTATLLRGAAAGGAFGGADALSNDATTGDFMKHVAIGAVVGAPLQLGGVLAIRGAQKVASAAVQKTGNVFSKLATSVPGKFFTSIGRQLERDYGAAGKRIADKFLVAKRNTRGRVGKGLDIFAKSGLFDLDDMQALQLADALEGKGVVSPAIKKAYEAVDTFRKSIALEAVEKDVRIRVRSAKGPDVSDLSEALLNEAKAIGLKLKLDEPKDFPFKPRENYFPHMVPAIEKLQRGKMRMIVLRNSVRNEFFKTTKEAEQVLDSYLEFTAQEGRGGKYWINWLLESKQAKTRAEAQGMALRFFRRSRLQRSGSLEKAREINYPFYDPDPRSVIPTYLMQTIQRLEEISTFGQKFEKVDALIGKVRSAEGIDAARAVARLVNKARGAIETSPERERISYVLRTLQIPKLSFAQVANIGQNLNTLLKSDLKSFAKGIAYSFTEEGKQRALQTGATLESVLRQAHEATGVGAGFGEKFLKYTGFTAVEKANRIVAANVGFEYARSTFLKLQRNGSAIFKTRLKELGINPEAALKRGTLTEEELQRAGQVMAELTQFDGDPLGLPAFVNSPEGKVIFQFKSFAYNQTKFLKNRFKQQYQQGNMTGMVRDLIVLGTVFPIAGEVISDIRSLLTGSKRPTNALDRYFQDFMSVGGFGIVSDAIVSANYGYLADNLLGPSVGTITDFVQRVVQDTVDRKVRTGDIKFLLNQTGFGRTVSNYVFPNNKKEQQTFLQTLNNVFNEF